MVRIFAALILSVLLSACSTVPDWFAPAPHAVEPVRTELGRYSFDWQLSGNRAVAPMQVFDDGHQTWLQFAPQQPLPAIFEHTDRGARPLRYTQQGPYIVLPGVWPELMFRGGALQSLARRSPPKDDQADVAEQVLAVTEPSLAAPQVLSTVPAPDPTPLAEPLAVSLALDPDVPDEYYAVSPNDLTLRATLARWASTAGWTFEPEHWTVNADIPIVGTASFALAFKPAVRELVASTELADKPLQPCFYSNNVLRIVPYAQSCDRTVGSSRTS